MACTHVWETVDSGAVICFECDAHQCANERCKRVYMPKGERDYDIERNKYCRPACGHNKRFRDYYNRKTS